MPLLGLCTPDTKYVKMEVSIANDNHAREILNPYLNLEFADC